MTEPLHVLLVEDEPGHVELASRAFEGRGSAFRVTVSRSIAEARVVLGGEAPPDVVVADWLLPDGQGLDLLRDAAPAAMPVVLIMTSHGDERVAVEAMRSGAADYVVKSETTLADLPHMCERAFRQRRIEDALGDLVAGTAASGAALFGELALRLARTLRVKYVSIAELVTPQRARTLARCLDGRLVDNVAYDLADTPCDMVVKTARHVHVPDVGQAFPRDVYFKQLGARSYAGTALRAASGQVLGLVNTIHDRPFGDALRPEPVLDAFAARAAAELERLRLGADLRRAAVEWREAFDGLPIGVVVVDGEGRIVRANRTAVECAGRSRWADVIDRTLPTLAGGEPWAALGELVEQLRRGGSSPAREVADPLTRRTFMVSARTLAAEEGSSRIVLNFQDVTETVRLKEQLRQSETMAEIGSIVAGVAHEVRNPLFSISATLDAFESRFRDSEGYERYLAVLRGEIVRLTTLMKDLLDFGRPSRPDFSECRLEEALETAVEACAPLASRKPVSITRELCPAPAVLADRARITQVLQNLIENAVHFSPPGGRVELRLSTVEQDDACYVEVAVKDSGPGFEPADLSRMFEPFFTRRRGGTGLGLSIVKRIVYDHGGEVTAENHAQGGAVVKVRLRGV